MAIPFSREPCKNRLHYNNGKLSWFQVIATVDSVEIAASRRAHLDNANGATLVLCGAFSRLDAKIAKERTPNRFF